MPISSSKLTFPSASKFDKKYLEYAYNRKRFQLDNSYTSYFHLENNDLTTKRNKLQMLQFFGFVINDSEYFNITKNGQKYYESKYSLNVLIESLLEATMPYSDGVTFGLSLEKYNFFNILFHIFSYYFENDIVLNVCAFENVFCNLINDNNCNNVIELISLLIKNQNITLSEMGKARCTSDYLFSSFSEMGILYKIDSGKYKISKSFYEEYQRIVCNILIKNDANENGYLNFKKILKWFSQQLNINNNLIEGDHHAGKGSNGESIRDLYSQYRSYNNFTLDCTIESGFNSTSSGSNYIHVTDTGLNVRPFFDKTTKEILYFYIDVYNMDVSNEYKQFVEEIKNIKYFVSDLKLDDNDSLSDALKELFDNYRKIIEIFGAIKKLVIKHTGAFNKIYYGAPGCGKSYYVENILLPLLGVDHENNLIRTTFYQDYSNTDFVGQILPKIDGVKVSYKFNPGPFTLALLRALKEPQNPVALVIEELNRGSAASIFGDIFQLLDRNSDGSSTYEITNVNIQDYLNKELGICLKKISIPSNLYIIATMNTSDQNVFTLDTAFKRRWKFEKIRNEFDGTAHDDWFVPGMIEVTWKDLVKSINEFIIENADQLMNEDKQIGVYFIDEAGLVEKKVDASDPEKIKEFSYKMLEYLWDDVAKYTRSDWFKNAKTLDQLLDEYKEHGQDVFKDGIIKKHED